MTLLTLLDWRLPRRLIATLAGLALLSGGCRADATLTQDSPGSAPTVAATSVSESLRKSAEAQYLSRMSQGLADLVRQQAWFRDLSPEKMKLVESVQRTEQASRGRGEQESVRAILEYASSQSWYVDGLDDDEALALTGIFLAYGELLSDDHAPPIGPRLSTTIKYHLFDLAPIAGSNERLPVLVSAEDADVGAVTLSLAKEALAKVQGLAGPYPYQFMYIAVGRLPPPYAGLSYEAFISIDASYVDAETITHEITHSTVYGLFPIWFEEGLAHFMEFYLTGTMSQGMHKFTIGLRELGLDDRLDLRPNAVYSFRNEWADRAEGFLLVKDIFDIEGRENFSQTLRALRKKTFNDQELLGIIVQQGSSPEVQANLRKLFCMRLIGSSHDFCS